MYSVSSSPIPRLPQGYNDMSPSLELMLSASTAHHYKSSGSFDTGVPSGLIEGAFSPRYETRRIKQAKSVKAQNQRVSIPKFAAVPSTTRGPSWTKEDDDLLVQARASGKCWNEIAPKYFKSKSPNACRKRYERLMEKRNAEDWDGLKLETLATAYFEVREQMWSILAARLDEKWVLLEQKCMEKGLKNLVQAARSGERKYGLAGDFHTDSGISCDPRETLTNCSDGNDQMESIESIRLGNTQSVADTKKGPSIERSIASTLLGNVQPFAGIKTDLSTEPRDDNRVSCPGPKEMSIHCSNSNPQMESIRSMLSGNTPFFTNARKIQLEMDWTISPFLRSQYGDDIPRVGSVVVLIGSALYGEATTCGRYITRTWPRTGSFFLELLEEAALKVGEATYKIDKFCSHLSINVSLKSTGNQSLLVVEGSDDTFSVELAQQFAWIGAAFSISPFGDRMAYARSSIQSEAGPNYKISIAYDPVPTAETACWLPLFCGAVLASGFPIPEREDETGLEIPLDLLAEIAGVRHAVEFDGGVVIKGFSHMFIPIRRTQDRVQWHAISSKDPKARLSYRDALSQCDRRASLQELCLDDLRSCRIIVGWCPVAASRLGSHLANYENIDYSAAADATSGLRCAGGSFGFQQIGMAALDFKFGVKDGKCHLKRDGPYQSIVSAAEKTRVVLYDTGEQRAWLVAASDVMLHMVQHRHWLEPFEVDGKSIKLDTNVPVGSSAKAILLKNGSFRLSDTSEYNFKDVILNIWSVLERLLDEHVARDRNSPGISINGTLREFLFGYEFKAVVEERSPMSLKRTPLGKSNGGWLQLVQDIDALVLLADGFEDLIVPANQRNTDICRLWQRVPKGQDYLATNTRMLNDLFNVAGCRLTHKYLTSSKLQWHQGDSILFDDCRDSTAANCRCNRLQRIYPESSLCKIQPPQGIVDNGAVIFGHSGFLFQDLVSKPIAPTPKISGIYSQQNTTLTPIIIRNESEDTLFSSGDLSSRVGPDATTSPAASLSSSTTSTTEDSEMRALASPKTILADISPESNLSAQGLFSETHKALTSKDLKGTPRKRQRFLQDVRLSDDGDLNVSSSAGRKRVKGLQLNDARLLSSSLQDSCESSPGTPTQAWTRLESLDQLDMVASGRGGSDFALNAFSPLDLSGQSEYAQGFGTAKLSITVESAEAERKHTVRRKGAFCWKNGVGRWNRS